MSAGPLRAALAVFLLGVLVVWLVRPIGDACPDLGKLPAGSRASSGPSFAPPLTRTCTYTTSGGTKARKRYVPLVDWVVLAIVAGVVGLGVGLLRPPAGPRSVPVAAYDDDEEDDAPPVKRRGPPPVQAPPPVAAPPPDPTSEADARAAERERERQQRAARRRAGGG